MQAEKTIEKVNVVVQTQGMSNSADEKPVSVRLPAQVKDELAAVAAKEKRSMNQTYIFLIERGLAAYRRDRQLFEPEGTTGAVDAYPGDTLDNVPTIDLKKRPERQQKRRA